MKQITLIKNHQHWENGVMTEYKAGETVELPDDVVDYINSATVAEREAIRAAAAEIPGTPENKAKESLFEEDHHE